MPGATVLEAEAPSLDHDLRAARDEMARNNPEAALEIWSRVRHQFPDEPVAYLHAGSALSKLARHEEADMLLRVGRSRFPDHPGFMIEHAWSAHNRGDFAEAIRRWEELRSQVPGHHAGYTGAANSLRGAGRFEEAEQTLVAAAANFPDEPAIATEYAWLAHHRRDWPEAASRWETVRRRFPNQQAGYTSGAAALRELGQADHAETLVQTAIVRFPSEAGPLIENAWMAHNRGDFAEAVRRWEKVREQFPDHHAGYTGAANSLRGTKQFDEADQLLQVATAKFPADPAVAAEHAWLAQHRRDWPEAVSRWEKIRQRFPNLQAGYTAGAVALREAVRYEDAEALLQSALARFPGDQGPVVDHAWLATARRDWPEAARRWARVREQFPDLAEGYLRGAAAANEMWQYDDAEALLREGMKRFPRNSAFFSDYAWIALSQRREDESAQRFSQVRELFPDVAAGYIGGALCLRNQFRLHEADALLEEGHARIPNEPRILLEHAQIPVFVPMHRERDYDEALRRLATLRVKFPQFEAGYILPIRLLSENERLAEADAFGATAVQELPESGTLAVEHAHTARQRADWPEAMRRYYAASERFPNQPAGVVGLATALSSHGRHTEAETLLREAITRFPTEKAAFAEFASIAARQLDWKQALLRWADAYRRFPDEKEFAHRIFEARLRLTESDTADAAAAAEQEAPTDTDDPRQEMRDLLLQFESLGGRGIGCEFGMFQREFAAEPLGLLRWADMPYDGIIFVLESRFEGVGLVENTELFLDRDHGRPEYCTRDKRGFMFQRCFIHEDDISYERMWKQTVRRLPFLRDKLITDLEAGNKIFVWRQTERNLTEQELDRLYRAVHSYGNNTLLYVQYEDADHPNGTVEHTRPGLMIGYIDRFKQLPNGVLAAAPASASWTALCKRAFALWKEPIADEEVTATGELSEVSELPQVNEAAPISIAAAAELSGRDLVMQFESLGGAGHGCEFGIFQRSQGAEPLGLLRWADLAHTLLTEALEARFDGVGLPENTTIFVPDNADEYWTTDKRYHMAMRSFIKTKDVPLEKVTSQMHRRLDFLRSKLVEDLEQGDKIFVFKNMFRNLTAEEVARLHAAVRSYGDNMLMYVRYERPDRPNGTVELAAPGLMIGYIDHFAYSPDDKPLGANTQGWLALCQSAHQTWMHSRQQRTPQLSRAQAG